MRPFARLLRKTIALLALFIALGGTTYAATALPKNSVGPRQLKKNAVTAPKVRNNSLTGADVVEAKLAKVPLAKTADTAKSATSAGNATTVNGYAVRRFVASVASGGAQVTVLDLNGPPAHADLPHRRRGLRGNNNSGAAAQLRYGGQTGGAASFGGGTSNFLATRTRRSTTGRTPARARPTTCARTERRDGDLRLAQRRPRHGRRRRLPASSASRSPASCSGELLVVAEAQARAQAWA